MILLNSYFISYRSGKFHSIRKFFSTFVFLSGLIVLILIFIITSLYFKESDHQDYTLSQILFNWSVSLFFFFILLMFYVYKYSYSNYLNQAPQEWLENYKKNQFIIPSKFEIKNTSRKYLIDQNKFEFISMYKEFNIVFSIICFLLFV